MGIGDSNSDLILAGDTRVQCQLGRCLERIATAKRGDFGLLPMPLAMAKTLV